jgi:SET domain-containing protein
MAENSKKAKNNLIKNLKNTFCCLKPSKIQGIGVFAIRDIPENTDPFFGIKKQIWHELKMSDFKKFDKEILKMIDDFFVVEKNGKVLMPEFCLNGMDISFFLNHSKNPNLKTIDRGFNFITMRKIKKGEELTVSYGTYDWKYKK